jgi:hypothetical protein
MTRHSKNSCAGSVFTYAERQRMHLSDHIENKERSSRPFGSCFMCMSSTAVDPVVCGSSFGHIGCKECFIKSILVQKRDNASKLKQFDLLSEKKTVDDPAANQIGFVLQQQAVSPHTSLKGEEGTVPFWLKTLDGVKPQTPKPAKKVICLAESEHQHPLSLHGLIPLRPKFKIDLVVCEICDDKIHNTGVSFPSCGHVFCLGCAPKRCQVCLCNEKDEPFLIYS